MLTNPMPNRLNNAVIIGNVLSPCRSSQRTNNANANAIISITKPTWLITGIHDSNMPMNASVNAAIFALK